LVLPFFPTFEIKINIMKKVILTSVIMLLVFGFSFAQTSSYKVVFDMTSHDTTDHKIVLRWLNEELTTHPEAEMEVVFYGKSLDMLVKDRSIVADQIKKLSSNKNISFKVCEVAMKNNKITRDMLLPEIQTVPDGIYEIVTKQGAGWGYIKVSH
jgi:intracellular sulfur oxidation DsrE/DsrF family protein